MTEAIIFPELTSGQRRSNMDDLKVYLTTKAQFNLLWSYLTKAKTKNTDQININTISLFPCLSKNKDLKTLTNMATWFEILLSVTLPCFISETY